MMSIENVQLAPAPSDAPERDTCDELAVAVIVPPPQEPVSPFGKATTSPFGRISAKAIPVSAVAPFGFAIVKVRLVESLTGSVAAPKAIAIVGGATTLGAAASTAAGAAITVASAAAKTALRSGVDRWPTGSSLNCTTGSIGRTGANWERGR